jgi:hypothetical protein
MVRDMIVEEVRRIREAQAAKYDFDADKILAAAKKRQGKSGFKIVSFASKPARRTSRSGSASMRSAD